MELFNQRELPCVQDYHFVNATEESDAIAKLRKSVIKECLNFKFISGLFPCIGTSLDYEQLPNTNSIHEIKRNLSGTKQFLGQLIPDSYLELEKRILIEKQNAPVEFPVARYHTENQLDLDEHELQHAVHFLNESGVLLHFEDPALQLRDLYFVDPEWLCKIMAQILTVKVEGCHRYPKGIIHCLDVEKFLFKKKKFSENYILQYFKLLEKFQIALPLSEKQLLIPSSLSDHRPVIELPHCENSEVIVLMFCGHFEHAFTSASVGSKLKHTLSDA
ncbi:unnamed protein product [Ranitomeya imitator]|uniref:COR domain-containing protein n=1 Tax=Ranitomeya imitator TaxID=111125 RepID=A0ABN9LW59_9NEOB|nr:unnamed protein product [Ranitomeya imitator]